MEVIDKSVYPVDYYDAHFNIAMDKPVNFKLLEEFCNIKNSECISLDLYENDGDILDQWGCEKSEPIQEFLDKCKEANIGIKEPLYWDLYITIKENNREYEANIGFDGVTEMGKNCIYLNMESDMSSIERVLSTIEKIDKKDNVIKVVK